MVDETLILRKLSELDEYYKQIKEYDKITVAQYSGDWKIQRIIERTLTLQKSEGFRAKATRMKP